MYVGRSDGPAEQSYAHGSRRGVKRNQVGCSPDLYEHIRLQKCEARKRLPFSASGAIVEAQQAKGCWSRLELKLFKLLVSGSELALAKGCWSRLELKLALKGR